MLQWALASHTIHFFPKLSPTILSSNHLQHSVSIFFLIFPFLLPDILTSRTLNPGICHHPQYYPIADESHCAGESFSSSVCFFTPIDAPQQSQGLSQVGTTSFSSSLFNFNLTFLLSLGLLFLCTFFKII